MGASKSLLPRQDRSPQYDRSVATGGPEEKNIYEYRPRPSSSPQYDRSVATGGPEGGNIYEYRPRPSRSPEYGSYTRPGYYQNSPEPIDTSGMPYPTQQSFAEPQPARRRFAGRFARYERW